MTFLFKPKSLLILAGFFFAYYFYNLPQDQQKELASNAVEKSSELARTGVDRSKNVSVELAKKVSDFVHTHAPENVKKALERQIDVVGADEVTKKMELKLKDFQTISKKWDQFRKSTFEEVGLSEKEIKQISELSEDFQKEVDGLLVTINENIPSDNLDKIFNEFEVEVENRFDSSFDDIVGDERLKEINSRRAEFNRWVAENYPNFIYQVKSFDWY